MKRRKFIKAGLATMAVAGLASNLLATNSQSSFNCSFTSSSFISIGGKKYKLSLKFNQQDIHSFRSSDPKNLVLEFHDEALPNEFTKMVYKINTVDKYDNPLNKYGVLAKFNDAFIVKKSSSGSILSTERLSSLSKVPSYFHNELRFVADLHPGSTFNVDIFTSSSTKAYILDDNRQESEDCFLTSACTFSKQLPDNCYELQTLRTFRDEYMKSFDRGNKLVEDYYQIAPPIVKKINQLPNKKEIYEYMYQTLVLPSIAYIELGEKDTAMEYYKEYTEALSKLLN